MYKWDVTHAMQLIQREKVTGMTAVPSMHIQIMEAEDRDKYDLSSLTSILSGGAPAPSSLADNVVKKYNGTKSPVNGWGVGFLPEKEWIAAIANLGTADFR